MFTVVDLTARETHPIRRSVLRNDTPDDRVEFDGDDRPDTIHLGARTRSGGELVAISTWIPRRYPDLPDRAGHQLRGMATLPHHRGSGIASMLLDAGLERCVLAGSTVVWARARDTALDFYVARGFEAVGPGFVDLTTGLPHHDVVRHVG
ncbi:MAG: GNAT family N-acetyltransferase [Ilumatobacter sp.]|nr:GNAT family N-acetyltransferase [Ilumatobacter sp.]